MTALPGRPAPALLVSATLFLCATIAAQSEPASPPSPLEALKAAGPRTGLTLYPVRALGRPDRNIANALGLVLERNGMTSLEVAEDAFVPEPAGNWDESAAQLAAFLGKHPVKAPYVLYAEYLGDPKVGPTEVRWLIATRDGSLVLSDRQSPTDPDFKRTAARDPDPLGCSMLVAERVFARLGWRKQPTTDGPFTRQWATASGLPGDADRAAMQERLAALRDTIKSAKVEVHATLIGTGQDRASAARLAEILGTRLGCTATAAESPVTVAVKPSSNQMKVTWDLARAFRAELRAHPPKTDYALLADFRGNLHGGPVRAVNFVLCDKAGDWVLVDLQNDQHPDFQRIGPKSAEDCERLVVERLAARVR